MVRRLPTLLVVLTDSFIGNLILDPVAVLTGARIADIRSDQVSKLMVR